MFVVGIVFWFEYWVCSFFVVYCIYSGIGGIFCICIPYGFLGVVEYLLCCYGIL